MPLTLTSKSSSPLAANSSFNYPVIVYDASRRTSILAYKYRVMALTTSTLSPPFNVAVNTRLFPGTAADDPGHLHAADIADFLCYGSPVEVYVVNRRLETSFSITLTAAIAAQTGHMEIAGYNPAAAAAQTPAAATPAAKGFAPVAVGQLLTTDAIINYFLNEEQFDHPLAKVRDDAAAVAAQAVQFKTNYEQYLIEMAEMIGPNDPGGNGNESLREVTARLALLTGKIKSVDADDKTFADWTEEADRLETDVTRISNMLQGYPVADTPINLRASGAALNDNIRGVLNEFYSLILAKKIILNLLHSTIQPSPSERDHPVSGRGYLDQRALAELRTQLRAQFGTTAVDDPTLARIMALRPSPTTELALELRLQGLNLDQLYAGFADELNRALTENEVANPAQSLCGQSACLRTGLQAEESLKQELSSVSPVNLDYAITSAAGRLEALRSEIVVMNREEAAAFAKINETYDGSAASVQVLTLDLSNYGKNLFVYYTISGVEQFRRYQILTEVLQPQSNCALSITANTSTSGGAVPCTTAAATPPMPASASLAATIPGAASTTPAAASPAATAPSATAAAPAAPATPSAPADFYGHFEQHRFINAALITGAAYDSVPNYSYSWFTCPTNPAFPAGNQSTAAPGCISPTTPSTATTPLPTYYALQRTQQAQVAAIQGITFYIWPKDSFTQHTIPPLARYMPGIFVGASAYPLNHYFGGLSEEPVRGFSITAGIVYGSETTLPSNSPYTIGSVVQSTPSSLTSSSLRPGFFVMFGFHTSLFGAVFNGSVFQNALNIGTAGTPAPSGGQTSQ
jgi:hypothetical protein